MKTFIEALALCPQAFNPLYVSMAKAGEAGGVLDLVLDRLATFQEKAERIKGRVVTAMAYPVAVLTVALVIVGLLMVLVVPRFQTVFADLTGGRPLPPFTLLVFSLSTVLKNHFLGVLAGVVGLGIGFRLSAVTRFGRRALERRPSIGPDASPGVPIACASKVPTGFPA